MDREDMLHDILYKLPQLMRRFREGSKPPMGEGKQQFHLLNAVMHHSGQPMRYYSDLLMIPKSNLSVAADSLIADGQIRRVPSEEDRRVICLEITEKGKDYLADCLEKMVKSIKKQLETLGDDEIEALHGHVMGIISILNKV